MSVKIFRLISGEEIIGDISTPNDSIIELKNPAAIIMQHTKDGNMGMGLMPFMPYAESQKITIYKQSISAECQPDMNLVNEYNRIFGSGIQIANVMPGK